MRKALWVVVVAMAIGCGGSKQQAEEPTQQGGWLEDSEPEYEPADDTLVPPEKFDEINHVLQRRAPHVSRCFGKVLEDGGLPKNTKGTVVVGLSIAPDGSASNVRVLPGSSIKNDQLSECVVGEVGNARFPTLPKEVDTSYAYQLERDY